MKSVEAATACNGSRFSAVKEPVLHGRRICKVRHLIGRASEVQTKKPGITAGRFANIFERGAMAELFRKPPGQSVQNVTLEPQRVGDEILCNNADTRLLSGAAG